MGAQIGSGTRYLCHLFVHVRGRQKGSLQFGRKSCLNFPASRWKWIVERSAPFSLSSLFRRGALSMLSRLPCGHRCTRSFIPSYCYANSCVDETSLSPPWSCSAMFHVRTPKSETMSARWAQHANVSFGQSPTRNALEEWRELAACSSRGPRRQAPSSKKNPAATLSSSQAL